MAPLFGAGSYTFVNPSQLELLDFVALAVYALSFVGYHLAYLYWNRTQFRFSFSSHVDIQRLSWSKFIFNDSKNKITSIQNFRSCLMIIAFYTQVTFTAAAAIAGPVLSTWDKPTVLRNVVPLAFLFVAFVNFALASIAYFYLHVHTQIEQTTEEKLYEMGESCDLQQNTLRTAALAIQCNQHFRIGWRSMVFGLIGTPWMLSPIPVIFGCFFLVFHIYYCDFPFSPKGPVVDEEEKQKSPRDVQKREKVELAIQSLPQ